MERKQFFLGILVFLVCLNLLAWNAVFETSRTSELRVVFFDVGQGDAIFIETSQGHQILIDGGPDSSILEKLSREMPFYDRSLDLVILTHPDSDHLSGLIEILKKYRIDYVLWTGTIRNTPEFKEWENFLQTRKLKSKIAKAGQRIIAAEAIFDILYPFENLEGKEAQNSNNTSVVTKLSFNKTSFLFPGDIDKSVEQKLIENQGNLDSDILKIAHHGSKTSSSEEFLKQVSAKIAVIQCSKNNPYGYPHKETLNNLEKYGIEVLRTDEIGDIKIISNGKFLTQIKNQ